MPAHAIALVQLGDTPGEIQAQAGAAGAVVDAQHIVGLLGQHGLGVTLAVVADRQHQRALLLPGAQQQLPAGITDRVGDDVGHHRADQVVVEHAHQAELLDLAAGLDVPALQHLLMTGQLLVEEVLHLQVGRTQRQLVDPELVQAQQLHQHAVEAGELVLDHPVFAGVQQRLGHLPDPLTVGLGQHRQRVLHVVHGGGDHRGEIQPLAWLAHAPNAR